MKSIAFLGGLISAALLGSAAAACPPVGIAFGDSVVSVSDDTRLNAAAYDTPTREYAHGVLGDAIEPKTLLVWDQRGACAWAQIDAGDGHVFEDTAPRIVDLNGDGENEVIVVRSSVQKGAQLAVYGWIDAELKLLDATPYIGTRNRWLAPIGAKDFDGDGLIEIAYIDRPHLAKILTIWRWDNGLQFVTRGSGLTNHRIGEAFISGAIRDCGDGPEMILANADWTRVLAATLRDGELRARDIGPYQDNGSFRQASLCDTPLKN